MASNWATSWLRFLNPTAKPKPRPDPRADLLDYGYSTLGGVSAAMTPEDLQGILQQAQDGICDQQAALVKEIQEKEPIIAAHLATRKGALTACPWTITGAGAEEQAEELTQMLKLAGLDEAIAHLADFIPTGYSAVAPKWLPGGAGVAGFLQIAPEAFEFDLGGNAALVDKNGNKTPLANYPAGQFVTVYAQAKPGIPCRNGLIRSLVWLYLFKHSGLAGMARYVEKYGVPFMLAKVPASQWGDRATVLATLKAIGRDHSGVAKEGVELETLGGASGESTDAQMRFLGYCDDVFAVTILGQLATSGDAGGLSKGQAQENVRMDLLAADARAISSAVNRQLIAPLCRMRYGWDDAKGIEFAITYEPAADLDALAARWKVLTEVTGRMIDPALVEETFGVTFGAERPQPTLFGQAPGGIPAGLPPELAKALEAQLSRGGDATRPGAASVGTTENIRAQEPDERESETGARGRSRLSATDRGSTQALSMADTPSAVRALDLVVADTLKQYLTDPEARDAWLGPIKEALREAFGDLAPDDVEGFKARIPAFQAALPRVLEAMDPEGLERALSEGMLAAMVNGYEASAASKE